MINFCIIHNAIKEEGAWVFLEENVEVVLHKKQRLASMEKCHKCLENEKIIKEFWKGGVR